MVRWWVDWRSMRMLPWPGGLSDQPHFVYDAIMLCEQTTRDARETLGRLQEMEQDARDELARATGHR